MFRGPYFIVNTMQGGTTPILKVFGMTGPSTHRESNGSKFKLLYKIIILEKLFYGGIESSVYIYQPGIRPRIPDPDGVQHWRLSFQACPCFFENPFKDLFKANLRPLFGKFKTYRHYADINVKIWKWKLKSWVPESFLNLTFLGLFNIFSDTI